MSSESESAQSGLQARLRQLVEQKSAANARIVELETRAAELEAQASRVDQLTAQVDQLGADLETARSRAARQEALIGAGVLDGSAREFLSYRYAQLSTEGRPDFSAWLDDQRAAADGGLLAHIFGAATPSADSSPASTPEPPAAPSTDRTQPPSRQESITDRGVVASPPNGGSLTWEQILSPSTPWDQVRGGWTGPTR